MSGFSLWVFQSMLDSPEYTVPSASNWMTPTLTSTMFLSVKPSVFPHWGQPYTSAAFVLSDIRFTQIARRDPAGRRAETQIKLVGRMTLAHASKQHTA
jgi:hypothetical protein